MRTTSKRQNFVGKDMPELSNMQYTSFVPNLADLENIYPEPHSKKCKCGCDDKKQNFTTGGNMQFDVENTSSLTGLGADVNLDNELYTNADGSLTGAEVKEIWQNSGTTLSLSDWLKTDASRQSLAYQLQLKTRPEAGLSARTIKKLYKESGSKLPINEWVKTDAAKGAMSAYAHKQSGSKQTFGDWLKTDTAQNVLANATLLTALALESRNTNSGVPTTDYGRTTEDKTPPTPPSGQTTILGMSPLTFGIVAIGTIVIAGVVGQKLIK